MLYHLVSSHLISSHLISPHLIYLSIYLYTSLSKSSYLSIHLSVYPSVCLSVCLSVRLSTPSNCLTQLFRQSPTVFAGFHAIVLTCVACCKLDCGNGWPTLVLLANIQATFHCLNGLKRKFPKIRGPDIGPK